MKKIFLFLLFFLYGLVMFGQEKGVKKRIGYTGDIGRPNMPINHDPNQLRDLDAIIMEGTYGNRLHSHTDDIESELAQHIIDTAKKLHEHR